MIIMSSWTDEVMHDGPPCRVIKNLAKQQSGKLLGFTQCQIPRPGVRLSIVPPPAQMLPNGHPLLPKSGRLLVFP